jgi:ribosomal protein L40E
MALLTFETQVGRPVDIDLCERCHAFWFDRRESLQLTPHATLQLFRTIGERATAPRHPLAAVTKCPRCGSQLVRTQDMQRNVRFEYRRCPHDHGRLTTFFDFLREKNFVRSLPPDEIARLRQSVQTVNCSNCGAPVDLVKASTCRHCGSPLTMLDMKQAQALILQLQHADGRQPLIDPGLPLRLERARREVEAAFATFEQPSDWLSRAPGMDLVLGGLHALTRWMSGPKS